MSWSLPTIKQWARIQQINLRTKKISERHGKGCRKKKITTRWNRRFWSIRTNMMKKTNTPFTWLPKKAALLFLWLPSSRSQPASRKVIHDLSNASLACTQVSDFNRSTLITKALQSGHAGRGGRDERLRGRLLRAELAPGKEASQEHSEARASSEENRSCVYET